MLKRTRGSCRWVARQIHMQFGDKKNEGEEHGQRKQRLHGTSSEGCELA